VVEQGTAGPPEVPLRLGGAPGVTGHPRLGSATAPSSQHHGMSVRMGHVWLCRWSSKCRALRHRACSTAWNAVCVLLYVVLGVVVGEQ
jgi:hypothetical protein